MQKQKTFRGQGAIGALLDEYEKSIEELKEVIANVAPNELVTIVDQQTKDEDCKSIQSILSHVVRAGYNYVIEIRKWLGEALDHQSNQVYHTSAGYQNALDQMMIYNEQLFKDYPELPLETYDPSQKIKVRWGQHYDVEQLFEHAIVHILRHRRQIEKFKFQLAKS